MTLAGKRLLPTVLRGFCADLVRVITVERSQGRHGQSVHVRLERMRDKPVVRELGASKAAFTEEADQVLHGAVAIFPSHGGTPVVHGLAAWQRLSVVDGVCPSVTKGRREVARAPSKNVRLSQTLLSVEEIRQTVKALERRFSNLLLAPGDDICSATQQHLLAVLQMPAAFDLVKMIGLRGSSTCGRRVEVAQPTRASDAVFHAVAESRPHRRPGAWRTHLHPARRRCHAE